MCHPVHFLDILSRPVSVRPRVQLATATRQWPTISIRPTDRQTVVSQLGCRLSSVLPLPSVPSSVLARLPCDPSLPPSVLQQCCIFLSPERERERESELRGNSFFPNYFCGLADNKKKLFKSGLRGIEFRSCHRDPRPRPSRESSLPTPPVPSPLPSPTII